MAVGSVRSTRATQSTRKTTRKKKTGRAGKLRQSSGLKGGKLGGARKKKGTGRSAKGKAGKAAGKVKKAAQNKPLGSIKGVRDLKPYDSFIQEAAKKYGVDANLIKGVIAQESKGDPNAGSNKGARGLMQLMPDTARGLGVSNRNDPRQSIMGGTKYLSQMLKANKGNVEKALWAYNAGPGNLAKGIKPAETRHYIPAVMNYANQYRAQGQAA